MVWRRNKYGIAQVSRMYKLPMVPSSQNGGVTDTAVEYTSCPFERGLYF